MLDGKKYLLVLDDVWNKDSLKWSNLKNMLISGAKESKILVTTHSDVVEEVSGSVHQHKLGDLSNEDSWTLFEKWAFECNKENKNSNLVEIGKEIVRKCGGVLLVIRYATWNWPIDVSMDVDKFYHREGKLHVRGLAHAIGDRILTNVVKIMKHLQKLTIAFNEYGVHEDLIKLEALQPHQNIEILEIVNYSGSRFPSILKSVDIMRCHNLATIPEWIEDLVSLNRLGIYDCPLLTSLPEGMRSLTSSKTVIVREDSSILK
ncbi:hypothetical protein BC332_10657 [Capsicum chinense]|nr:hypothetical protein BC332_10657 [Capsicum chinense]